jgi:hypothetical protein
VQPNLFQADGLILGSDFSDSTIRSPTGSREKPPELVVGCVHPTGGSDEAVRPERVRAGIQQPGAMALVLSRRIDHELIDRTLPTTVGIVILVGHRGGKTDDSLAVGCDENSEAGLRRSLNGRTPGFVHLSQRHRAEHQLRKIGRPLSGPRAPLQLGNA